MEREQRQQCIGPPAPAALGARLRWGRELVAGVVRTLPELGLAALAYTAAAVPHALTHAAAPAQLARTALEAGLGVVSARFLLAVLARFHARSARARDALLAIVGLCPGLLLALSLTEGAWIAAHPLRHAVRAFVVVAGCATPPLLARWSVRELGCSARVVLSVGGVLAALAHATLLRGLYPALHFAWIAAACSALTLSMRNLPRAAGSPALRGVGVVGALLLALLVAYAGPGVVPRGDAERFSEQRAALEERAAMQVEQIAEQPPPQVLALARPAATRRVVIVLVDTLRADIVEAATASPRAAAQFGVPNLFALARRSARYRHAYTQAAITHMATSAIVHGLTRADAPREPAQHLAAVLAASERKVQSAFVGWSYFQAENELVDAENARSLSAFEATTFYRYDAQDELVPRVREQLARFDRARPALLVVHFACMHDPGYDGAPISQFVPQRERYLRSLRWFDRTLGALGDELARDAVPTTLILTSDHGEGLGDHDFDFHGLHTYEEQIRVPLWVSHADLVEGERSELALHADLAPSVTDLLDVPAHPSWRGRSWFRAGGGHRYAQVHNTSGREVAFVDGTHKLVLRATEHLLSYYDLVRDSGERAPLPPRETESGRALLRAMLRERPDLFPAEPSSATASAR